MPADVEDPLLRSSRREAIWAGVAFVGAMAYTVSYCAIYGFQRKAESLTFIWGFPDWVFWGFLVPWAVCTVLACCFSYFLMEDHDLEIESGPTSGEASTLADVTRDEESSRA